MSTFKGIVEEFYDIRIDYFRPSPYHSPPLACFLSHVHSDHLVGLETLKAPFVYCSPATKEILMRLERYPHRINFAKGVLEARKVTYRGLGSLLKPIPLETPTIIELRPGREIQVTLFDANHCTGAVMFLIEGDGKAILYTGDVRSEPSFVNSIGRNPFLIEYTSGLKRLDCIYLDTSFTEPGTDFPTKAEGLGELLKKIKEYPADTVFHFAAWTFGYEEVWMALSKALKCQVHVDSYKMRIYSSLCGQLDKRNRIGPPLTPEAPVLAGYTCGNSNRSGCLTLDQSVRLHSCEQGTGCSAMNNPDIVWIRPIIARTIGGSDVAEAGIGGGGGDLTQRLEVELDNIGSVDTLLELLGTADPGTLRKVRKVLADGLHTIRQTVSLVDTDLDPEEDKLDLQELVKALARSMDNSRSPSKEVTFTDTDAHKLPKVITFPYSRHSSYYELLDFVRLFKPKDVFPCTVDEDGWNENVSMESLFGVCCPGGVWRHDMDMRELKGFNDDVMSMRSGTTERSDGEEAPDIQVKQSPPVKKARSHNAVGTIYANFGQSSLDGSSADSSEDSSGDIAFTPGSDSQNVRRHAIWAALQRAQRKRKREIWDDGSDLYSYFRYEAENLNTSRWDTSQDVGVDVVSHWDPKDEVYRCNRCGFEVWQPYGDCQGCDLKGHDIWSELWPEGPPYLSTDRYPDIVGASDIDTEVGCDLHDALAENYLDNHTDAYDSYDDCSHDQDEYEVDSFVDDSKSELSLESSNAALSQPESDDSYAEVEEAQSLEKRYNDLFVAHQDLTERFDTLHHGHQILIVQHDELHEEFREFRHDIGLDSDLEDYSDLEGLSDMYSYEGEDFAALVDVQVRDPQLAEITIDSQSQDQDVSQDQSAIRQAVTQQANGESQVTDVSEGRIDRRVEAWEDAENGVWSGLMSAEDNHATEEIEL